MARRTGVPFGAVPSIRAPQRPGLAGFADLVQVGVEPADAQPAVGAQSPDLIDVPPDDPRRVPRIEDEGERPGGDQLLSLELPPLLPLAPGDCSCPAASAAWAWPPGADVCAAAPRVAARPGTPTAADRQHAGTREGRQQRVVYPLGQSTDRSGAGGVTGIDSRRPSGTHGRGAGRSGSVYKSGRSPVHSPRWASDARSRRRQSPLSRFPSLELQPPSGEPGPACVGYEATRRRRSSEEHLGSAVSPRVAVLSRSAAVGRWGDGLPGIGRFADCSNPDSPPFAVPVSARLICITQVPTPAP